MHLYNQKINCIVISFLVTFIVHFNVKMEQVVPIQHLEQNTKFLRRHWKWQLRHFDYIAGFYFLE